MKWNILFLYSIIYYWKCWRHEINDDENKSFWEKKVYSELLYKKQHIAPTCGLYDALEDDDDLELLAHERPMRQIEEWALGVDLVADSERRH